jgi:L-aminopeptidase/D-esterase-like protein
MPDDPRRRAAAWSLIALAAAIGAVAMNSMTSSASAPQSPAGLTAVAGLKVGHFTLSERPTGCTVVLAEAGVVAGVDVRGSAPGTRETDLLDPVNLVSQVHAIVLSGGSAFGLDAASGVVRFLDERGVGYQTSVAKVPIVPAAILFDLPVGDPRVRPTADCGYRAASAAGTGAVQEGNVGAGAGATVGKFAGPGRAMKGGIGTSAIVLPNGLVVAALMAVNVVGDVIDPANGRPVAGVRTEDGRRLADVRQLLRAGAAQSPVKAGESTTIGVVATNARLTKAEATKMARMAHDGVARAVYPAHTPYDGDTIFALSTGALTPAPDLLVVGGLAADAVTEAILRAVRAAKGIPGYPAAADMTGQ